MAVLNGNDAFSILVLSTKKRYSNLLKKAFGFQKVCFKAEVLRMFKGCTDCHIKTCWSLKRRAILKIPKTAFRRTYALSVNYKMLKKAITSVKTKTNSNFVVKFAERSNHSVLLSISWFTFFKHLTFNMW